jgi:hypothetical protein
MSSLSAIAASRIEIVFFQRNAAGFFETLLVAGPENEDEHTDEKADEDEQTRYRG